MHSCFSDLLNFKLVVGSSGMDIELIKKKLVQDAVEKETAVLRAEIENLKSEQKRVVRR